MTVRGNLAVILGRDVHVIDVSDPHQPVEVGQYHPFQYPLDAEVRADMVYLAIGRRWLATSGRKAAGTTLLSTR